MKICFLANSESIHIQRWVNYFTDTGHEVHIISDSSNDKINIENVIFHQLKNINSNRNPVTFYITLIINIVYVNYLIRSIKPDILHAHYVIYYGFYGVLTSFHPLIISVWGSDVLKVPDESLIANYIVRYSLKGADKITTTAEFMRDHLSDNFKLEKEKIIRIPWGINTNIFYQRYSSKEKELKEYLGIGDAETVVISNRSMAPQYNIDKIIEAIPYVLKSNSNTVFVFIKGYGTTNFEKKMRLKARKLNITNNVRFISKNITPKEMATYLNISNMFVSITKTDQFASSIMEGMACGLVPIVSNIDVYHQYLSDDSNALFVNPDNPQDLAEKIIYCINNPEIKENFYKINKKIIENHENWDKNARKMEKLYEEMLKEGEVKDEMENPIVQNISG